MTRLWEANEKVIERGSMGEAPAHAHGALVLGWLADNRLLREWVTTGLDEESRDQDSSLVDTYRRADGILASDMLIVPARGFVSYLYGAPRWLSSSRKSPIERVFAKVTGSDERYAMGAGIQEQERFAKELAKQRRGYALYAPFDAHKLRVALRQGESPKAK